VDRRTFRLRERRRTLHRADRLDGLYVLGALLTIAGVVVDAFGWDRTAAALGFPGLVLLVVIVVFSGWWELDDEDLAMGEVIGWWGRLRRALPVLLILASASLVALAIRRIVTSDEAWFYRYALSAYWIVASAVGFGHARLRGRRLRREHLLDAGARGG